MKYQAIMIIGFVIGFATSCGSTNNPTDLKSICALKGGLNADLNAAIPPCVDQVKIELGEIGVETGVIGGQAFHRNGGMYFYSRGRIAGAIGLIFKVRTTVQFGVKADLVQTYEVSNFPGKKVFQLFGDYSGATIGATAIIGGTFRLNIQNSFGVTLLQHATFTTGASVELGTVHFRVIPR